jgi:hypothetical protein
MKYSAGDMLLRRHVVASPVVHLDDEHAQNASQRAEMEEEANRLVNIKLLHLLLSIHACCACMEAAASLLRASTL